MNPGQKMFHDFFMSIVKEGNEEEAEKALTESFEKQAAGTFMEHFASKLS